VDDETFSNWLIETDNTMVKEKMIVHLLLDNCPAHSGCSNGECQTGVSTSQLHVTTSASEPGHYTKYKGPL
jgi:hypothetical protein